MCSTTQTPQDLASDYIRVYRPVARGTQQLRRAVLKIGDEDEKEGGARNELHVM